MTLVIGLNSGSSFDGIDVVLIEVPTGADGLPARRTLIMGRSYDWPKPVADIVLRAFENEVSLFEFGRLNDLAVAGLYVKLAGS